MAASGGNRMGDTRAFEGRFVFMQDIQSQGATRPSRTFSLTADEAGMAWQSNVQLDLVAQRLLMQHCQAV
jgi:hypothetical protein